MRRRMKSVIAVLLVACVVLSYMVPYMGDAADIEDAQQVQTEEQENMDYAETEELQADVKADTGTVDGEDTDKTSETGEKSSSDTAEAESSRDSSEKDSEKSEKKETEDGTQKLLFAFSQTNTNSLTSASEYSGAWRIKATAWHHYPGNDDAKTRRFNAYTGTYDSDKATVAYCLMPEKSSYMTVGDTNASHEKPSSLTTDGKADVEKCLYYCYGYPGWSGDADFRSTLHSIMEGTYFDLDFVKSKGLEDSDFNGKTYNQTQLDYMVCHILLSMFYYDGITSDTHPEYYDYTKKAFKAFWRIDADKYADTRSQLRKLYEKVKTLPSEPDGDYQIKLRKQQEDESSTASRNLSTYWKYHATSDVVSFDPSGKNVQTWDTKTGKETFTTAWYRVYCLGSDRVKIPIPKNGKLYLIRNAGADQEPYLYTYNSTNENVKNHVYQNGHNGDWIMLTFPANAYTAGSKWTDTIDGTSGSFKAELAEFEYDGEKYQSMTFAVASTASQSITLTATMPEGYIYVYKRGNLKNDDASSPITGNPNYCLEGARVRLTDSDGSTKTGTISEAYTWTSTTGVNGYRVKMEGLHYGTWKVQEISPASGSKLKGYTISSEVKEVVLDDSDHSGAVTIWEAEKKPDMASMKIYKKDAETGQPITGGDDMTAIFTVSYYSTVAADTTLSAAEIKASYTPFTSWQIKTDDKGIATLSETASGGTAPQIYEGVLLIHEDSAPDGYKTLASDIVIPVGDSALAGYEKVISDNPIRGNLTLKKLKGYSGFTGNTPLANVLFRISLLDDSGSKVESHYIVTDSNGEYNSAARAAANPSKKNSMDGAVTGSGVNTSLFDSTSFAWFGTETAGGTKALLAGTYLIEEMPCPANAGLMLHPAVTVTVSTDGQTVSPPDGGNIFNTDVSLSTVATEKVTGKKMAYAAGDVVLKDSVSYLLAKAGTGYTLKTRVMDTSTGSQIGSTASRDFTASSTSGTVSTEITVPASYASALKGKKVTIYEDIWCTDSYGNYRAVGSENDLTETSQQIEFANPDCSTVLTEKGTGAKQVFPGTVTLEDTVSYTGLIPGVEVTLSGSLVDQDSEAVLATASSTFTPSAASGTQKVEFTLDASALAGNSVVAYEKIMYGGAAVCSHESITDADQTVEVMNPSCSTVLTEKASGGKVIGSTSATLTDRVTYSGLIAGRTYTLKGSIRNGSGGSAVTADVTRTFTPTSSGGTVSMDFTVDAASLTATSLVAYEEILYGGTTICSHKDLADSDQTVSIGGLETSASQTTTGYRVLSYTPGTEGKTGITDKVTYTSLEPGKTYSLVGSVHKKSDGSEVAAKTQSVTASSSGSGTWTMNFTDVPYQGGDALVVFQKVMDGSTAVLKEENINQASQTVYVPLMGSSASLNALSTVITETVTYSGLKTGETYRIVGTCIDRTTGSSLMDGGSPVTDEKEFTATSSSGTVTLLFDIDPAELQGRDISVSDTMYMGTRQVCIHNADGSVASQTVHVPDRYILPSTGGTDMRLMMLAGLAALMLLAAAFVRSTSARKE